MFVEFHVEGWPLTFNVDRIAFLAKTPEGKAVLDYSPNINIGVERFELDEEYEEVKRCLIG